MHLETRSPAPLRSTCPNHLILPRLTTLSTPTIPSPHLSSSLELLSFRDTPDIHLTMLFPVLSSLCTSSTFIGQVSLQYTSTLCTHAIYIFPFTINEAPLAVNNPLKSLNFPKAHITLALLIPPPHRRLSQSHHPNNKICQQPPTPPSLPAQTVLLHPPPSSHPQNSSCT